MRVWVIVISLLNTFTRTAFVVDCVYNYCIYNLAGAMWNGANIYSNDLQQTTSVSTNYAVANVYYTNVSPELLRRRVHSKTAFGEKSYSFAVDQNPLILFHNRRNNNNNNNYNNIVLIKISKNEIWSSLLRFVEIPYERYFFNFFFLHIPTPFSNRCRSSFGS